MRDYAKEYRDYHGKPYQIKRRNERNKARKLMEKMYGKDRIKGYDVHHKNFNTNDNRKSNLQLLKPSINRGLKPKYTKNSSKF